MKRQQITLKQIANSLHEINADTLLNAGIKLQIEYVPKTNEIKILTIKTKKIHVENGNITE